MAESDNNRIKFESGETSPDSGKIPRQFFRVPISSADKITFKIDDRQFDIPIILCTGFSKQIDENRAKEIGLRAFVMKSILRREIANTIRKVLDEE